MTIICADETIRTEIQAAVDDNNWVLVRELVATAKELGIETQVITPAPKVVPAIPVALEKTGPSRKTILRNAARRKAKPAQPPISLGAKNKFLEALLAHPATQDALERTALIQIAALRRGVSEVPALRKTFNLAIELIRGMGPLDPYDLRRVLYPKPPKAGGQ
jgi:hypothetical protein